MKNMFSPQDFFDLSFYSHRSLFDSCEYAWEALNFIDSYLDKSELGSLQGSVSEDAFLINPHLIRIGIGSVVEPGAYIQGPCIIGNYCTVRHGAYIRGGVITGDHCVIGHDTEVKNSILLNKAQAAHFSYVGDSILGHEVNLGAGVKLANLLFKKSSIQIEFNQTTLDTKRRKLGAIIGDEAQIGCNSVTNPGTLIGKKSCIYPCLNVGGVILQEHAVRMTQEIISYPQKSYAFS